MELTQRQRQVIQGLMDGLTYKQIGYRYEMAGRTVSMHMSYLKKKFNAVSVNQVITSAIALGLVEVPTKEQIIRRIEKNENRNRNG